MPFSEWGGERLHVLGVTDSGLSKSRNVVLRNTSGDFVWFLDDDVSVKADSLDLIRHMSQESDVVLARVGCANGPGLYKNYDRKFWLPFSLLRVSSIELIVNRRNVLERGVFFDERLGLGAKYPCGEENAFLLDLHRSGARFERTDNVVVYHPCSDECQMGYFKTEPQMFARGIVAARLGFMRGFVLCCYWSLRSMRKGSSFRLIRSMFAGFFEDSLVDRR
jgi:glycosyltransferase involved in cell wall biosynthesis